MCDNLRRFTEVRKHFLNHFPHARARQRRHLQTLAALVAAIVGARQVSLPALAHQVPEANKASSREQKYRRFVAHSGITQQQYFLPFVRPLLEHLAATAPLVVVFDGSVIGRGCVMLMASLVYKRRAIPLSWIVRAGEKGHFPEALHLELLEELVSLVPATASVTFLGDGEFDSVALLDALEQLGWSWVCRTASNRVLFEGDERFRMQDVDVANERYCYLRQVGYSNERYGPVQVLVWQEPGYKEPVYLVTNLDVAEEAIWYYRKRFFRRFRIASETLFSDQKSRGFKIDKSHLSDPVRLARLMMAAALAYIWDDLSGNAGDSGGLARSDSSTRSV